MTSADVLIAGAGLGGCATALCIAQAGGQVMLVGPQGSPGRGLSGEWLHPGGVTVLQQFGISLHGADCTENNGFVLYPGPGRAPVVLRYPHGIAVSTRHDVLVERLRQAAAEHRGITLLLGERVTKVTTNGPTVTTGGTFRPGLLVGGDGRASMVRRALRPTEPAGPTLSATAGFELTGAQLPVEGYGHIFLGGPGPALAYRIDHHTIRLSLDVAPRRMAPPEMLRYLQRCYAPALPEALRAAFLETLSHHPRVRWATNRLRRRLFYGHGQLALVGDAVGFGHPVAAQGMTMAIQDAECLARRGDITSYTRERRARSWAAERLSMAIHRALTGTDTASVAMRESLFHLWSHNATERDRMMRLLAVQEDSRTEFVLAVAHIAGAALSHGRRPRPQTPLGNAATQGVRTTVDLAKWLLWLCGPNAGIPLPDGDRSSPRTAG